MAAGVQVNGVGAEHVTAEITFQIHAEHKRSGRPAASGALGTGAQPADQVDPPTQATLRYLVQFWAPKTAPKAVRAGVLAL